MNADQSRHKNKDKSSKDKMSDALRTNLLKRKEFITDEFDVVSVLEGSGNWSGYAKHFELKLEDGRTFRSGVRGNQALLKDLLEQEVKPTWVTCRYFELTPDGVPRFPVVIDWGTGVRND